MNVQDDSFITTILSKLSSSLEDADYRQMAELIFLNMVLNNKKYKNLNLILNPEGDERRKHKVMHAY